MIKCERGKHGMSYAATMPNLYGVRTCVSLGDMCSNSA